MPCDARCPTLPALSCAVLCCPAHPALGRQDWWWKARLGKCYYQLGLLRDAEKQFKSALKSMDMIGVTLELCKIYLRMDQV